MRVKCIKTYNDSQLKRLVEVNEELEVTEDRGKVLLGAGVCVEATTPTTEVVTESKPKAKRKKKA